MALRPPPRRWALDPGRFIGQHRMYKKNPRFEALLCTRPGPEASGQLPDSATASQKPPFATAAVWSPSRVAASLRASTCYLRLVWAAIKPTPSGVSA